MHEHSLDGHATLAAVDECTPEQLGRDRLDIGVGQHDGGIVTTQLQRNPFEIGRRGARQHALAGSHRSHEADLVDARMFRHPATELVASRERVEEASRQGAGRDLAHSSVASGVNGDGFRITLLPVTSACAAICAPSNTRRIPRSNRAHYSQRLVIEYDTPLRIAAQCFGVRSKASSPSIRAAVASISRIAADSGLPCSRVSKRARLWRLRTDRRGECGQDLPSALCRIPRASSRMLVAPLSPPDRVARDSRRARGRMRLRVPDR